MHLSHISLKTADPEALTRFYRDILGMDISKLDDDYWLCAAENRFILIRSGNSCLDFGAYLCESEAEYDAIRARLESTSTPIKAKKSPLFTGKAAFSFVDPDGNSIDISWVPPQHSPPPPALKGRLQHLVVASDDIEEMVRFYTENVGFVISDRVVDDENHLRACFMRSDDEHHCLAVFKAASKRLDHHCYEAGDWNSIRDWADHLSSNEIPIIWGPGRHGPGNNLFLFFKDPDGNWLEISAELETLDDGRPVGEWEHAERTLNLWGKGMLRS
jgi:catechol 2,3-dioxygenase